MVGGANPSTWNFASNWPHWSENADFQSIFARSASAVTPSEKSSISSNRKSTTRFPLSLRWTSCIVDKPPPQRGLKSQNGRSVHSCTKYIRRVLVCWQSCLLLLCTTTAIDTVVVVVRNYYCCNQCYNSKLQRRWQQQQLLLLPPLVVVLLLILAVLVVVVSCSCSCSCNSSTTTKNSYYYH